MPLTIAEFPFAIEIIDGLLPVVHNLQVKFNLRFLQGAPHEEHIVVVVLRKKNERLARVHAFSVAGNWIQNLLPLTPSDSTPAFPPMRSAALRTMARPMPVPS